MMKGAKIMETFKNIAEKLFTIKSLVTLALTGVFCYLSEIRSR